MRHDTHYHIISVFRFSKLLLFPVLKSRGHIDMKMIENYCKPVFHPKRVCGRTFSKNLSYEAQSKGLALKPFGVLCNAALLRFV